MEFSGHADGQTQSLGHSGYARQSGEGRRQNGDMETPLQVLILYDSVFSFKSKDDSSTSRGQ